MAITCRECRGEGKLTCPVCGGSRVDPRNTEKPCRYCDASGYVTCPECMGRGWTPDEHGNL